MKRNTINVYIDRIIVPADSGDAQAELPNRFEAELREGLAHGLAGGVPAGLRRSSRVLSTSVGNSGGRALGAALGQARRKGNGT